MKVETVALILFVGWLIGWVLKYFVFGLAAWDNALHPERYVTDTTGPFKIFSKPFLGVFSA